MGQLFAKPDEKSHGEIIKLNVELDSTIWNKLPKVIYDRIADFADIDTRRAMGFKPRKLHIDRTQTLIYRENIDDGYESFKYFPDRHTIIFFSILNYNFMIMKVWNNVRYERDGLFKPIIGHYIEQREYSNKRYVHFPRLPLTIENS